jgi:hypothetical protein
MPDVLVSDLATATPTSSSTVVGETGGVLKRFATSDLVPFVNVKHYGAVGDGETDDTAAIDAAEAFAYANNRALLFPCGFAFGYSGKFQPRVDVWGYGATLKQLAGSEILTNVFGVVYYPSRANLTLVGLSIDGNFKSTGVGVDGGSGVKIIDVSASNVIHAGFNFYSHARPHVARCLASDIRYQQDGAGPADGFFFGGCTDALAEDCRAYRPRRIGFVSEGNGATKGDRVIFRRCITDEPHYCDNSAAEYNTAFWAENTNSVDFVDCVGVNIAGNAGQTSGRVAGMVVLGLGNNAQGTVNAQRCRMYGGAGRLPVAYSVDGSGTYGAVNIEDCFAQKITTGVHITGGAAELSIARPVFDDIVCGAANGGVLVDGRETSAIDRLMIERPVITNGTFHADSGWVNVFSRSLGTSYTLRGMVDGIHVMRQRFDCVSVCESSISLYTTLYSALLGDRLYTGPSCKFTSASVGAKWCASSALSSGSEIVIDGGLFVDVVNEFGGTNVSMYVNDARFNACRFDLSIVGTFVTSFNSTKWYGVGANGAIRCDYAPTTKHTLLARGNHFESTDVAYTPIKKWNNDPTKCVLQGNTHTATALTDFSAPTSAVDNVAV